ncbi:hypothetical protein T484DRAFT_1794578 [Baffinella frigidus]|nr:hypothetical protein T484DRAFT_1794578 [Cryptophyta sp. CCMP2293]
MQEVACKIHGSAETLLVACKIHELNPSWSEEKRSNYMKHATREYEIQKKLSHTRIVRLLDVFEVSTDGFCTVLDPEAGLSDLSVLRRALPRQVSTDGFCTVLEHCDSGDLEQLLKEKRLLPEREARSVIMQLLKETLLLPEREARSVIMQDFRYNLGDGTSTG